ncbi:VanZ family protein [Halalkalibacter alkalisediminis]|uniref:VanZ family protein n=1 Tax=Halalkalibacter alkalisediminis TaxID=935616 RepID=A0ABV6NJA1_9BACI|nr:VanZ family protein [Halalkalibacter alkalisediminis]
MNALRRSRVYGKHGMGTAFFICVLYAISAEVHHLFIPGRSKEVRDVLIDSSGALVGLGFICLLVGLVRRKR